MSKPKKDLLKKTKTYQYLEQALVLLMQKKQFEDITVKNLVDKAGISRTAFYSQFTCKQDFVDHVIENTHSGATIISTDYQNMDLFSESNFVDYYIRFYKYVASKSGLYAVMLSKNGLSAFRDKMKLEALGLWLDKHFTEDYMAKLTPDARKVCEVMLSYIISAHIGLVEYWLEGNMSETPQYMANQLYHMTWMILRARAIIP